METGDHSVSHAEMAGSCNTPYLRLSIFATKHNLRKALSGFLLTYDRRAFFRVFFVFAKCLLLDGSSL